MANDARALPPVAVATVSFEEHDWLRRLLTLNPWAVAAARTAGVPVPAEGAPLAGTPAEREALDAFWTSDAFAAARKAECLRRWQAGEAHWNDWAKGMLVLKAEAEAALAWDARRKFSIDDWEGRNALTRAHLALAAADFEGHTFPGGASFDRHAFPGRAGFERAVFGDKEKSPGAARFNGAQFAGGAALFSGAQFAGGDAWFVACRFGKHTNLNRVRVCLDATRIDPGRPIADQGRANFTQAVFEGPVSIEGAEFHQAALFASAQSKVAFSLAGTTFKRTPDFIEATFHEPPRLDNVTIAAPLARGAREFPRPPEGLAADPRLRGRRLWHWLFRRFAVARDANEHARFRKLRKMASDAKDHELEVRFNAHEIAARRFWVDAPWLNGVGRFWLGWLYATLSGYGLSVGRPLAGWGGALAAFAVLYWALASGPVATPADEQAHAARPWILSEPQLIAGPRLRDWAAALGQCSPSYDEARTREVRDATGRVVRAERFQPTDAYREALALSFRNALIFDRSDTARRMYGCLYGVQDKGGQDYPVIPWDVTVLSSLQSFLSAIFIFLFGLGLRNMFRIR